MTCGRMRPEGNGKRRLGQRLKWRGEKGDSGAGEDGSCLEKVLVCLYSPHRRSFFPLTSLEKRRRVRGKKRHDEGSRDRREGEIEEAAAVERRAEEEERREGERLGEE